MFQVFDCANNLCEETQPRRKFTKLAWEVYNMWPRSRLCWWYCSGSHRAYVVCWETHEVKRSKTLWIKLQERCDTCACCDICESSSLLLTSTSWRP